MRNISIYLSKLDYGYAVWFATGLPVDIFFAEAEKTPLPGWRWEGHSYPEIRRQVSQLFGKSLPKSETDPAWQLLPLLKSIAYPLQLKDGPHLIERNEVRIAVQTKQLDKYTKWRARGGSAPEPRGELNYQIELLSNGVVKQMFWLDCSGFTQTLQKGVSNMIKDGMLPRWAEINSDMCLFEESKATGFSTFSINHLITV